MPRPRAASSTTTSSTWPRSPVREGAVTRVAVPTMRPESRATKSSVAWCAMTASVRARSNAADAESCTRSDAIASASASVSSRSDSIVGVDWFISVP